MIPDPIFRNRSHAGSWLAHHLRRFRGPETVVLGIPRGGVIVAAEIARHLGAKLDVAIARKLPAPDQPEVAIGAVTPSGGVFLDAGLIRWLGVGEPYIRRVIAEERVAAERREHSLRGDAPPVPIRDKVVIVVDDGLATGATMRAALRAVRQGKPQRLIAAAPVGSPEACHHLQAEADEVVCPLEIPDFRAVGRFYEDFRQTSDRDVQDALAESHNAPLAGAGSLI